MRIASFRPNSLRRIGTFLLVALFLAPLKIHAQVTGTISGYVTDPSSSAVTGTRVSATSVAQGFIQTSQADSEGFYNLSAVPPGVYTLTAERSGFQQSVRSEVVLTVGQNLRVDFKLILGTITQQVTVTGAPTSVDTRSATISGLVDDRRIVDLPLNGRNVISLAETVPGVLAVSAPQQVFATIQGMTMNVNGGRDNMNLFMLDGGYFNNPRRNTGMIFPPPDAIQEFRIEAQNFSAEYGHNPGSEILVISKAGTNQFHGDGWEFVRNDALNARNFFAPTVPALKENQFGATAGGPIKKDKIFLFGEYEALRIRPQAVPQVAFVPSAAERSGDFTSQLPTTVLTDPIDPLTGRPWADSSGVSCVTANIINPNCISPAAENLLKFVPQSPTGSLVSLASSPSNGNQFLARMDWNQSSKHSLSAHFYLNHNTRTNPFAGNGDIAGYVATDEAEEADSATLNDTYTLNASLVNLATVSYFRSSYHPLQTPTIAPSQDGINMPQYLPNGAVSIQVAGGFTLGSGYADREIDNTWQIRDILNLMKGRHNFKFGGELLRLADWEVVNGLPGFAFGGSRSGDPMADFLLGAYANMSVDFGIRYHDTYQTAPSLFLQDAFRVTPRLTLDYGIRWEPFLPWINRTNRLDTVVIGAQSVKVPDAPPGVLFPGDPGIARGITPGNKAHFAPRFGFAWDVFGNGRTSVRGAYGIFYESINADSLAQENPPFEGDLTYYDGLLDNPFASAGQTAPPVSPSGQFGCTKISSYPGISCALFPLPVGGFFMEPNFSNPYIQAWNLSIQRQLTPSIILESAYVGKIGTKVEALRTYNPARFIPGTTTDPTTGLENTVSNPANDNDRVLYEPGILSPEAYMLGNDFRSWYHAWETQLTKRMSHGVQVVASYTLSKSIDSSSTDNLGAVVSDPFNLRTERGRSDWDRRHAFVASWVWSPTLNTNNAWKNKLLGGWSITGITTLQSGSPVTAYYYDDVALDGTGSADQHAFLTGQKIGVSHPSRAAMVSQFFNANAFTSPTCGFNPDQTIEQQNCTPFGIQYSLLGRYGQSGRGILSGPGLSNTDLGAFRDFTFKERYALQFRMELFNAFNQVSLQNPDSYVEDGPGVFGAILGANSGRVIQFALKMKW